MTDADDPPAGLHDDRIWTLDQLLRTGVTEFEYLYDFGDDWSHRIVVEPATRGGDSGPVPLCLAGENACPPEDVGGPPGYTRFLEVLADSRHEEHRDYVRWIGGVWDPKGFDLMTH